MTDLSVYMSGRLVGTLDATDRRSLRFTYDPAYSVDPASTPLSVSMPLRQSPYPHSRIHPYLWGLLPDNDRVLARWAREFSCSASDVTALLANVGTDVAGAAQYVRPGDIPDESLPGSVEWLSDDDIAQFLRDVQRDTTAWRPHPEGRWSLAGAQAKIALLHDDASDRWGIPSGATPTTHILKPAIVDLDDFDLNEHLCLAAAHRLGLRAALTSMRTFADQRALVVSRYDRLAQSDGSIVRVHQEDLCQARSVHPERKYESDGGPSAADLGRLIAEVAGAADLRRLHNALAYNWLVMATDGHAKNFSLLLSGHQVRLAPMYDVATGLPHIHPQKARLAQKIGGENRPTRISSRHWERLANEIGIDPDESRARIESLIDRLPDALADAAHNPAFTSDERRIADTIVAQITDWLTTPRLNMDMPGRG
jgi:serine/threonine-protein kinase HipA